MGSLVNMPGANCSFYGCGTSRKHKDIGIFKLPSPTNERRTKWRQELLDVILRYRQLDHNLEQQISRNSIHVCQRHFTDDQILIYPSRKMLKEGALPTLNLLPAPKQYKSQQEQQEQHSSRTSHHRKTYANEASSLLTEHTLQDADEDGSHRCTLNVKVESSAETSKCHLGPEVESSAEPTKSHLNVKIESSAETSKYHLSPEVESSTASKYHVGTEAGSSAEHTKRYLNVKVESSAETSKYHLGPEVGSSAESTKSHLNVKVESSAASSNISLNLEVGSCTEPFKTQEGSSDLQATENESKRNEHADKLTKKWWLRDNSMVNWEDDDDRTLGEIASGICTSTTTTTTTKSRRKKRVYSDSFDNSRTEKNDTKYELDTSDEPVSTKIKTRHSGRRRRQCVGDGIPPATSTTQNSTHDAQSMNFKCLNVTDTKIAMKVEKPTLEHGAVNESVGITLNSSTFKHYDCNNMTSLQNPTFQQCEDDEPSFEHSHMTSFEPVTHSSSSSHVMDRRDTLPHVLENTSDNDGSLSPVYQYPLK